MSNKEIVEKTLEEKLQLAMEHIRRNSAKGKFTTYSDLLEGPINLKEEEIDEAKNIFKTEEYGDLIELKGKKNIYLYSNLEMTDNYAKMLLKIEEKDLLNLVAETVRYDSKKYPRTTDINVFFSHPFNFNKEEFENIIGQMKMKEEYKDIKESLSSDGLVHFYSDLYLTQDYADALTKWVEIQDE